MTLELHKTFVREVRFGSETRLSAGVLTIHPEGLAEELRGLVPEISRLELHLARPSDSIRIVCVKDVIEARFELPGGPEAARRQRALSGLAVATCGQIVGFQEGIVDMSGPGADYTPFSALNLLVLEAEVAADCEPHRHEAALRRLGLAAAELLAAQAGGGSTDRVERFRRVEPKPGLPRIAYLYMVLSQGLLHDTWVEGRNALEVLPRSLDPALPLAGAIVSGNCVSACDKNTTWHHQNNAVLRELFRRDGLDLNLVDCVVTHAPTRLGQKKRSAEAAVDLLRESDAEGVIISKEGFGNPDADSMMLIRGLEGAGIRCVLISDEFAGIDGSSQSLADTTPEANALISVGNANERILLPPLARTLGPIERVPRLAGAGPGSLRPDGSVEVELQSIVGATNQIGQQRLTARNL